MSCLILSGVVAVGNARRVAVPSTRPNANPTWYHFYDSMLSFPRGESIPAELRIYSPPGDVALLDNSVVLIAARAQIPATGPAVLDTLWMHRFNINTDTDIDVLPENACVSAFGIGSVQSRFIPPNVPSNAASAVCKNCTVHVAERVRDEKRTSLVQCSFAGNSARWSNVPVPGVQSTVAFFGTLTGRTATGAAALDLEHITFGVQTAGTTTDAGNNTSADTSQPPSTPKRRKFDFRSPSSSTQTSPSATTMPLSSPLASLSTLPSGSGDTASVAGTITQVYPAVESTNDDASTAVPVSGRTRADSKRKAPSA